MDKKNHETMIRSILFDNITSYLMLNQTNYHCFNMIHHHIIYNKSKKKKKIYTLTTTTTWHTASTTWQTAKAWKVITKVMSKATTTTSFEIFLSFCLNIINML